MRISINRRDLRIHGRFYVVQFGDSLFSIAQKFNTTVEEIRGANKQIEHQNTIFPGEILFIPNKKAVATQRKRTQRKTSHQKKK